MLAPWAADEMLTVDLHDQRLNARLTQLLARGFHRLLVYGDQRRRNLPAAEYQRVLTHFGAKGYGSDNDGLRLHRV